MAGYGGMYINVHTKKNVKWIGIVFFLFDKVHNVFGRKRFLLKIKYNCLNEIHNYTGFCIENGNE